MEVLKATESHSLSIKLSNFRRPVTGFLSQLCETTYLAIVTPDKFQSDFQISTDRYRVSFLNFAKSRIWQSRTAPFQISDPTPLLVHTGCGYRNMRGIRSIQGFIKAPATCYHGPAPVAASCHFMSCQPKDQTRGVAWKPIIEHASRDFVDEQLQREPFCSVSLVEGKLRAPTRRLDGIQHALVRFATLRPSTVFSFYRPALCKDTDILAITLLEKRLRAKASGEGGSTEPNAFDGKS